MLKNPYQVVGSYDGTNYVPRDADCHLRKLIDENTSYPYFCAARQSGKSSLIAHTIKSLTKDEFLCVWVDFSIMEFSSVEKLFRDMLYIIADRLSFNRDIIDQFACNLYENILHHWLVSTSRRIVVFLDEIDALMRANQQIHKDFSVLFLAKIRSLFNKRSESKYEHTLSRLQFVLSGAIDPIRLAPDRWCSPFNVGDRVDLLKFTIENVEKLCVPIFERSGKASKGLAALVYKHTNGVVYLTKLVLHELWYHTKPGILVGKKEVIITIDKLCRLAADNAHFINIYQIIKYEPSTYQIFLKHYYGARLDADSQTALLLTGLCSETEVFSCLIYAKVFGSESSSLNLLPNDARRQYRPWLPLIVGTVGMGLGVGTVMLNWHPRSAPILADASWLPAVDMTELSTPIQDLNSLPDLGEILDLSIPNDLSRAKPSPPHISPMICATRLLKPHCFSGPTLTNAQKELLAAAASDVGLRLCPGQQLTLVRDPTGFLRCRRDQVITNRSCELFTSAIYGLWDPAWPRPTIVEIKCVAP